MQYTTISLLDRMGHGQEVKVKIIMPMNHDLPFYRYCNNPPCMFVFSTTLSSKNSPYKAGASKKPEFEVLSRSFRQNSVRSRLDRADNLNITLLPVRTQQQQQKSASAYFYFCLYCYCYPFFLKCQEEQRMELHRAQSCQWNMTLPLIRCQ